MTTPDSTYAKPFLTVREQVRRLRERGMECGTHAYAAAVLERYGYYRLSGYWHLYRVRPAPPAPGFDEEGREIRLDSFVPGVELAHVVSLYEFDHELRSRLGDVLSAIEISFRFFIGHRLGRVDKFAHRKPELLGAMRDADERPLARAWHALIRRPVARRETPTRAYLDWLDEYDRHEKRARGDFVLHFRDKYGPHLPIWVATEVMSFGVLSKLYGLMPQADQEVLAARFQINAADGRGDRGALANWLNSLRNIRNIYAHYGRLWNRTFDVLIDAPGRSRKDAEDPLHSLAGEGVNNKLYGVLLVMQHLLRSISPTREDVVEIVDLIEERSRTVGFSTTQLGFPSDWRDNPIWDRGRALDDAQMLAASLLDRVDALTAPQARATLTAAEPEPSAEPRTPRQMDGAKRGAQKSLLRTYLRYKVVIEIELGATKYYPAFQFRDGKIIDALAEINRNFAFKCPGASSAELAKAMVDWWQAPHPDLPAALDGSDQSPLDLLVAVPEYEFEETVRRADATSSFGVRGKG